MSNPNRGRLIALVATAVLVDGVRKVIQPGDPLPELHPHDEKALTESNAAEDTERTAYLNRRAEHTEDRALAQFHRERENVLSAAASTGDQAGTGDQVSTGSQAGTGDQVNTGSQAGTGDQVNTGSQASTGDQVNTGSQASTSNSDKAGTAAKSTPAAKSTSGDKAASKR